MPVLQKEEKQPFFHQRRRMLFTAIISIILLVSIILTGLLLDKESIATNLIERNVSPSWSHLFGRSEEHTSELQSRGHLVCRLLPEKKKCHSQSRLRYTKDTPSAIRSHHHKTTTGQG